MAADELIEGLARRDRVVVLGGLLAMAGLAWLYLLLLASEMGGMGDGGADMALTLRPWQTADALLMFLMWVVMMVAMMVPSAAPMILLFAAIARKSKDQGQPIASAAVFASGYLVMWIVFSALATGLQWGLEQMALLSPMMTVRAPLLGGLLLIVSGLYQLTPLKHVCLENCRSPVRFLTSHWRDGAGGAFVMGLDHGLFCLGCCWVLMALLFVGGVMNLLWIAAMAGFVLIEKLLPYGRRAGQVGGVLMLLAGAVVALQA
jgi:predicted metal-binding membrane protein